MDIPQKKTSYLELIIGPMFCGKTSKLIEIAKQCDFCGINFIVINHDLDDRYHNSMMSTHDNIMITCVKTDKLMSIWYKLEDVDVILINEGQFFPDLYEVIQKLLLLDKKIYVAGLDGDFERKKFGSMLDLIPICDKVYKLNSLCSICKDGTPGIFSMRISNEKEQTVVGSSNYIPVCRNCYQIKNI
jgi:thymidine kinase